MIRQSILAVRRLSSFGPLCFHLTVELLTGCGWIDDLETPVVTDIQSIYHNEYVAQYQDLLWGIFDLATMHEKECWYVDFISNQINGPAGKILDCGSGSGNLTLSLAARGFQVTGLEISPRFVTRAKQKLAGENAEIRELVKFVEGDLCDFPLPERFNVACFSIYTFIFPTKEEQLRVIKNVRHYLSAGGKLIIFNFNYPRDTRPRGWWLRRSIALAEHQAVLKVYSRARFEREDGCFIWDQDWIRFDQFLRGRFLLKVRNAREKYLKQSELYDLLSVGGFNQVTFYGSLDGQPYHVDSPLLIAVATE